MDKLSMISAGLFSTGGIFAVSKSLSNKHKNYVDHNKIFMLNSSLVNVVSKKT